MDINDKNRARLDAEDAVRAPLIKQIIDAAPIFHEDDFTAWTTDHVKDLAGRVALQNKKAEVDAAYAKAAK